MRVFLIFPNFSASFDIQISWWRNVNANANPIYLFALYAYASPVLGYFMPLKVPLTPFCSHCFSADSFVGTEPFSWVCVLDHAMMFIVRKRVDAPKEAIDYKDGHRSIWRRHENHSIFDAYILHSMCIEYILIWLLHSLAHAYRVADHGAQAQTHRQNSMDMRAGDSERARERESVQKNRRNGFWICLWPR